MVAAWLAGVAPFAAVVVVSFRAARPAWELRPAACIAAPGMVTGMIRSTDRRGDHVCVVGPNALLMLSTGDGRTVADRVRLPFRRDEVECLAIDFWDRNADGLVDLSLIAWNDDVRECLPEEACGDASPFLLCATYLQRPGGFRMASLGVQQARLASSRFDSALRVDGRAVEPEVHAARKPLTRLISRDTGRVSGVLSGIVVSAADFDGDGSDEVLTVDTLDIGAVTATYRLRSFHHGTWQEIWARELPSVGPSAAANAMFLAQLTDLDLDGVPELAVASPDLKQVEVLTWARIEAA